MSVTCVSQSLILGSSTADIGPTDIATTDIGPTVIGTTDIGTTDIGTTDIAIQLILPYN